MTDPDHARLQALCAQWRKEAAEVEAQARTAINPAAYSAYAIARRADADDLAALGVALSARVEERYGERKSEATPAEGAASPASGNEDPPPADRRPNGSKAIQAARSDVAGTTEALTAVDLIDAALSLRQEPVSEQAQTLQSETPPSDAEGRAARVPDSSGEVVDLVSHGASDGQSDAGGNRCSLSDGDVVAVRAPGLDLEELAQRIARRLSASGWEAEQIYTELQASAASLRQQIDALESWTVDDPCSYFQGEVVVSLADVLALLPTSRTSSGAPE